MFCLWYPICYFSAHMFMEFAYLRLISIYILPIFCLKWYPILVINWSMEPICCFSAHMFTVSAYFPPIFRLTFSPYSAGRDKESNVTQNYWNNIFKTAYLRYAKRFRSYYQIHCPAMAHLFCYFHCDTHFKKINICSKIENYRLLFWIRLCVLHG